MRDRLRDARRFDPVLLVLTLMLWTHAHAAIAHAQHGASPTVAPSAAAPKETSQFDFLVGQWELTASPKATTLGQKIHGVPKLIGVWKAWRAFDGWGIEDEVRLTDGSGNPRAFSHATRFYDAKTRRWNVASIDVTRGTSATSTAEWRGAEMVINGRGTDEDGHAYLSRATFTKISNAGFTYRLDRSTDNGATWTEGITTIVAKRVAATAPR